MSWSTRQLAELAGSTLRTVRHYHEIGLLPEPERSSNGYKKYGTAHLVRLLQIRNLADLGFTLSDIAEMDAAEFDSRSTLDKLDAQLAETIARLQDTRAHIRSLKEMPDSALTLDSSMTPLTAHDMTENEQGFLTVFAGVASDESVAGYVDAVEESKGDPVLQALAELPADAEEARRAALARDLRVVIDRTAQAHPELSRFDGAESLDGKRAREALRSAITELYNPAQIDVIARASAPEGS